MKSILRISSVLLVLFALSALTFAVLQQPAREAAQKRSSAASPPASEKSNRELTHAANQAAGRTSPQAGIEGHAPSSDAEDEEAAFKYSPAVQGIARITGMSLTSAYWLCVGINFAIIAALIFLATKSSVPAMLRGRTRAIQSGIEEARRASADAKRRLQEVETRLSRLSVEIGEMQRRAEFESRAEEERIRTSIEEEKQKIVYGAEVEVAQAVNTARRELQKYAVELAVAVAEKGLRVDPDTDKVLVEEFTEQLDSDARRNGSS